MIVIEQLANGRTLTYSDRDVWIRQLETGNLYMSANDCVQYTYEETDIAIEGEDIDNDEIVSILLGGDE